MIDSLFYTLYILISLLANRNPTENAASILNSSISIVGIIPILMPVSVKYPHAVSTATPTTMIKVILITSDLLILSSLNPCIFNRIGDDTSKGKIPNRLINAIWIIPPVNITAGIDNPMHSVKYINMNTTHDRTLYFELFIY